MLKNAVFYLFVLIMFLSSTSFSANSTNATVPQLAAVNSTGLEYPDLYTNSDGSLNTWCNYIAAINIASPLIQSLYGLLAIKLAKKWHNQAQGEIDVELAYFNNASQNLKELLSEVIQKFDNDISDETQIHTIEFITNNLDRLRCQQCNQRFVELVSVKSKWRDVLKFATEVKIKAQACYSENGEFRGCSDDSHHDINCKTVKKEKHLSKVLCSNWSHVGHLSSIGSAIGMMGAPFGFARLIGSSSLSGSYIGDVANVSNSIAIPAVMPWAIFREYSNYDYNKALLSNKKIDLELQKIDGIIEIVASVIGAMDNNLNEQGTRGFVKIFIYKNCPKEVVKRFIDLASKPDSDYSGLYASLKGDAKEMAELLPYVDSDLEYLDLNFSAYKSPRKIKLAPVSQATKADIEVSDDQPKPILETVEVN